MSGGGVLPTRIAAAAMRSMSCIFSSDGSKACSRDAGMSSSRNSASST